MGGLRPSRFASGGMRAPGLPFNPAQVKCSPRRDTVLGVVPWAIPGRCPLCGAPAELEFDDLNVDGQPPE
jgi:hypothetical protein